MKIDISDKELPVLGIVVPCFNEEEVLFETNKRLKQILSDMKRNKSISNNSSIFYVDDGSRDATWSIIEGLSAQDEHVSGIKLSRNCGHQNALLAGLMTAKGSVLISIDADLQDDVECIPEMIRLHRTGHEIVYAVRKNRESDTYFKRWTAEFYYKLMALVGVDIVFNHADYRLMSRQAISFLSEYGEVNIFLRGLIPLIGLRSAIVEYDRAERFAGESKYPLKKMLSFAWQGITSFSTAPLRFITIVGIVIAISSVVLSLWALMERLFTSNALPGWTSTVVPMYFLGGVQLLSLGIIGEYVSKIYSETKSRPKYHVECVVVGGCLEKFNQ